MREKHFISKLSAFVNHELSKSEQQQIGEHLMQCTVCRREHDRIKLGSTFAAQLVQHHALPQVWDGIENALDAGRAPQMTLIPKTAAFGFRDMAPYAVAAVLVFGLATVAYISLFRPVPDQARKPAIAPEQSSPQIQPEIAVVQPSQPANVDVPPSNSNTAVTPDVISPEIAATASWEFDTLAGSPTVGAASTANRLAVGDVLETDAISRARIAVADIGNVEIRPNSRVKLIGTDPKQHRLSLERGSLHAKIFAPPRLFIVDTPSAVAVDLGCEYTLEVDKAGNNKLHVTSGFVALERGGRESIVPAGAMCLTRKGKGLGTPFSAETTEAFRAALERFDFAGGGSVAVDAILASRNSYDIISLWHLLSRVSPADRGKVYDALVPYVGPPEGVTREGVLKLNKKMLETWREEVERVWFE